VYWGFQHREIATIKANKNNFFMFIFFIWNVLLIIYLSIVFFYQKLLNYKEKYILWLFKHPQAMALPRLKYLYHFKGK
jgi:hypothetical protein